jgi:hypothetical protein
MQNWGEDIFKPTTGNESLHQDSNDNSVRIVKFCYNKSFSGTETQINAPGHLMGRLTTRLITC